MFLMNRIEIPFNILLSTIIRDSGMAEYKELRRALFHIKSCLEEMLKVGSICKYELEYIYSKEKKNKIEDVKFLIYVSESFFDDLKLNFYAYHEYTTKDSTLSKITVLGNYDDIIQTNVSTNKVEKTKKEEDNTNKNVLKDNIKSLLQSVNIQEKDIKKIISTTSEKKLKKIEINVQAGIDYINKQSKIGNDCNNLAIISSAINNDWGINKNSNTVETEQTGAVVKTEYEQKQEIENILVKIKNKNFKQITAKIIEYFGLTLYNAYFRYIDFISLRSNILHLSINNGYAFDIINRDYLNGVQKVLDTGEKIWYKKGIKELVQEIFPKIEIINLVYTQLTLK